MPSIIFMIDCPTTFSEFVKVGISALVESDNKQRTPSSPRAAMRWISAGSPTGVQSNLKSPVQTILPCGVWITIPRGSGIEWVVRKKVTLRFLNVNSVLALIS